MVQVGFAYVGLGYLRVWSGRLVEADSGGNQGGGPLGYLTEGKVYFSEWRGVVGSVWQ